MKTQGLFFSDKWKYRIARHSIFWAARFFMMILFNAGISVANHLTDIDADIKYSWIKSSNFALFRMLFDVAYCYAIAYWLIPKFLSTKKYGTFASLLAVATILSFIADLGFLVSYYDLLNRTDDALIKAIWYQTGSFINSGPPVICVFFLALKMLKNWYLERERRLTLADENAKAELQLLKAQMHPHFLFNTLNNIYSFTLTQHPAAAGLVTKLSGLLDYINSEGEKDRVPVEKEIQLIRDYISLEKVRYGDRLDMHLEIDGDLNDKWIAPLLMLPFVENSFKHGASIMRGKQWISLKIYVEDNCLKFDLKNSKPLKPVLHNGKNGIGLRNVQKRLRLIYPGRHLLNVESMDIIYSVHLEILLEDELVLVPESEFKSQSLSYA